MPASFDSGSHSRGTLDAHSGVDDQIVRHRADRARSLRMQFGRPNGGPRCGHRWRRQRDRWRGGRGWSRWAWFRGSRWRVSLRIDFGARSSLYLGGRLLCRHSPNQLLRPAGVCRDWPNRAGSVSGPRTEVSGDLSSMWLRRKAADHRRRVDRPIRCHAGNRMRAGCLYHLRRRVRTTLRSGQDLLQLLEPCPALCRLHDVLQLQRRMPRPFSAVVSVRTDRQYLRDVLYRERRFVRHDVETF